MTWPTPPQTLVAARIRRAFDRRPWSALREEPIVEARAERVAAALTFEGYGPGLHAMRIRVAFDFEPPPSGSALADAFFAARVRRAVDEALAPHLARQDARHLRAEALGPGRPLDMPDPGDAAAHARVPIGHLLIDRHILSIVVGNIARNSESGAADLQSVLQQLCYDAAVTHDDLMGPNDGIVAQGDNLIRRLPVRMAEMQVDGRAEAILKPTHALGGPTPATFDGATLAVAAVLPDTALASAVGRPLGDLVATGTALDSRTILDAGAGEAASAVRLGVDPVRIKDLPWAVTPKQILGMPRA